MNRALPITALLLVSSCSMPSTGPEPSLAPRPAEAIDPRVPIAGDLPKGAVDPALAAQLELLVSQVRAGASAFQARAGEADRLASSAGSEASENWVAAQQALSLLIEQYGVTSRAAADVDALASGRLEAQRWITPADQAAIAAAAADIAAISAPQADAIDRLKAQLSR